MHSRAIADKRGSKMQRRDAAPHQGPARVPSAWRLESAAIACSKPLPLILLLVQCRVLSLGALLSDALGFFHLVRLLLRPGFRVPCRLLNLAGVDEFLGALVVIFARRI